MKNEPQIKKPHGAWLFVADLLSHLLIALSVVLLSFFVLDRFNRAMNFINNGITKWMLVFYGAAALILAAVFAAAVFKKKSVQNLVSFGLCMLCGLLSVFYILAGAALNIVRFGAVKWGLAFYAALMIALCVLYIVHRKKTE